LLFLCSTRSLPFRLMLQPLEDFIPAEHGWAGGTGPLLVWPHSACSTTERGWSALRLGGQGDVQLTTSCPREVGKGAPA